jgi:hypothetical protein
MSQYYWNSSSLNGEQPYNFYNSTQKTWSLASSGCWANHPVIDADGHWIEFEPVLLDYLDNVAGPRMVDRFRREDYLAGSGSIKLEQRHICRFTQPAWWGLPTRN